MNDYLWLIDILLTIMQNINELKVSPHCIADREMFSLCMNSVDIVWIASYLSSTY